MHVGKATKLCIGDRVIGAPWQTKKGQGSWQRYAIIKDEDAVTPPTAKCFADRHIDIL